MSSMNVPAMITRKVSEMVEEAVRALSERYGFNSEEALASLALSSKKEGKREKGEKLKVPLPFEGAVNECNCFGVKKNRGLYTQCVNKKSDGDYCKVCVREISKGKSFGDIRERAAQGEDWRSKDGKKAVHYTVVMKKLKLTREMVELELARCGREMVSEAHFVVEMSTRGRPKKTKSDDDSNSDKKRGRPKKQVKEVELSSEDLISQVVADMVHAQVEAEEDEMASISDLSTSDTSETSSKKKAAGGKAAKKEEKAAKEQEKAAKKAAKEQEKAAKEQKKAAKEQEKAAKEEKKAAKEQEKAAKEEEKAAKKAAKEVKKAPKEDKKKKGEKSAFLHNGVNYLKDEEGVVYKLDGSRLGTWSEVRQAILWDKKDEELESEDEDIEELESESDSDESDSE
jgi:hypothetical protein